jgi:cellulose synthase/poly-beta-1,6-N-acetylglucosamine synthase-like glycosyltransferase
MVALVFWVSAGVLLYTYAGYPLLLWLIVRVRGARAVRRAAVEPRVSLVISAYNEAAVMAAKLDNARRLDYPRDRLEVVVVSDASTDGTDDIVRAYALQGVRLIRQEARLGKTAGLNRAMPGLTGEIVVFSDANAMYEPDALRKLVRNFADPEVGCVTGEARYLETSGSTADSGERAYWGYEIQVKRLETAVGSMVGGDGAIYAIRRDLWRILPDDAINDFLNPLQIVARGYRAVYEPEAVCFEETAGGVRVEYHRRIRIVSRSWRALFQAGGVLNPFAVGFFTVSVVSHKVLRWLSGLFAFGFVTSAVAAAYLSVAPRLGVGAVGALAALALLCTLVVPPVRRLAQYGWYFTVITLASAVGVIKGSVGRVSGTWSTPRQQGTSGAVVAPGPILLTAMAGAAAGLAGIAAARDVDQALAVVFWGCLAALAYVYLLYPVVLWLLSGRAPRPVRKGAFEPAVCLFITANDEEAVMEAKLRNSLALDYPRERLEIVVASDGSVDATNEIVRSFARSGVRLLAYPERRGKIAAINDGMAAVTSDVVVFSDANAMLDRDAVRHLVENFADEEVGAVSGDVVLEGERAALARSEDLYYRYERQLQAGESQLGTMVGVDGALYALRRELFVPPAPDTILDDMAIPMAVARAGRRVVFEPLARAHERGCDSATEEFVRKVRVVAGAVQFLSRRDSAVPLANRQLIFTMVSHKALRWLSPAFAFSAFASSLALAGQSPVFLAAAVGQSAFLLAGLAGCLPGLRRLRVIGIAHYFWLVQAAAAVGFARGLLGQQPVAWRRFQRAPVEVG